VKPHSSRTEESVERFGFDTVMTISRLHNLP
jgi:hypothetical protein